MKDGLRHIKTMLLFVLFVGTMPLFYSQQMGTRSHYFIQEYLLNPAFTGSKDYNPFYLSYRQQWAKFANSPEFFSSSGYYTINNTSSVSGSFYRAKQGSEFSQTLGQFNYSHDFHFHQNAHLTFGGGLILDQFNADFSGVDVIDVNDPAFYEAVNIFNVDAALGVKYFLHRFKLGFSVSNLFGSNMSQSGQSSLYNKRLREYITIAQYDFTIDSLLHLEPLLVHKFIPESNMQLLDLSLLATYNKSYTLGISYRTSATASLIGGIQYKRFYFLYSHEINVSNVANFLGSNNEITAGYRFKLHPDKIYVDNDMDGIINKKDSCVDIFGTKKHLGCPIDQWVALLTSKDTLNDSIVVNDSLMFTFKKLSSKESDLLRLYLVDKNGDVLYKAIKTEDGFLFNYLPFQEKYYFRLDNLPEGAYYEGLTIKFSENGEPRSLLSRLNASNGFFEYKRLTGVNDRIPKLLLYDSSNRVIDVGVKEGEIYVFKNIKSSEGYRFATEYPDPNLDTVNVFFTNNLLSQELIYNKLTGFYEFISNTQTLEEDEQELSALLEAESDLSSTINTKILDVLDVLEQDDTFELSEEKQVYSNTYFSIQIGAYENQMNDKLYRVINKKYGNKLQILFDERLQLQKYIVDRYTSIEQARKMNSKLSKAGFKGCFVIGVENKKIVDANELNTRLK